MKSKKMMLIALSAVLFIGSTILFAADHIDSPAVTNQTTDITDVYAFRAADPNNMVFVANTQGLLSPGATGAAKFDANTLIEFNIDNNNDKVEDLVIQCIYDVSTNSIKAYGPILPSEKGTRSKIEGGVSAEVSVTPYGASPIIANQNSIKLFAGPRDDPFFFDLNRFKMILAGTSPGGFTNPGIDAFAGTNVMSIVIELPKTLLGGSGMINVWLETKKKI
jgi:hypothetical protein